MQRLGINSGWMAALVHLAWKNSKQAKRHTSIISRSLKSRSLVKFALRAYNYTFIRRAHSTASAVCFFHLALKLPGALTASSQGTVAIIDLHSNHGSTFVDDLQRVLEHRRCHHLRQRIKSHQRKPIDELVVYGSVWKGTIATTCRWRRSEPRLLRLFFFPRRAEGEAASFSC